jgi:hypothetical protein
MVRATNKLDYRSHSLWKKWCQQRLWFILRRWKLLQIGQHREVQEAASLIYQASLFSAAMASHADFSPAAIFKRAATMYESGHYTVATTLKTAVDAKQVVESQEDTVQGLFLAAACVKTMPAKPAIERSSITPGVVVVNNSQGIFQIVGPKGKVFVPRRVLLDSEAQSLMLGASAIEGFGLTKDTL